MQQVLLKETTLHTMRHIMTHYGNFEIGSTLANHLHVFDETFEFFANLEPTDYSPVISDSEIIFPEISAYYINQDFWNYIYTGDNEKTFPNSLNITFRIV